MKKSRFRYKYHMLEEYSAINQEVAKQFGYEYVNIIKSFQKELPWWYWNNRGWLTTDGEHENGRGTEIVVKEFSIPVRNWLESINATKLV